MASDLDRKELSDLPHWDHGNPAKSLDAFAEALAFGPMRRARDWYFTAKQANKTWGRRIRLSTWALGGVAVVIPVAIETLREFKGGPVWQWLRPEAWLLRPGMATLALLLAAGLVWLDRFYGYTSGWLRYMEAAQRIVELHDRFAGEWATVQVGWVDGKPSNAQVQEALAKVLAANAQLHAVVRDETKAWAAEFRDALRQLEEQVSRRYEARQQDPGGLEVEAEAAEGATLPEGWLLTVSGQTASSTAVTGRRASLALPPGIYQVRGEAKLALADGTARRVADEKAASVDAGRVATVKLHFG
jgi:conflict system pore-forming effector with SLATT domain